MLCRLPYLKSTSKTFRAIEFYPTHAKCQKKPLFYTQKFHSRNQLATLESSLNIADFRHKANNAERLVFKLFYVLIFDSFWSSVKQKSKIVKNYVESTRCTNHDRFIFITYSIVGYVVSQIC